MTFDRDTYASQILEVTDELKEQILPILAKYFKPAPNFDFENLSHKLAFSLFSVKLSDPLRSV